MQNISHSLSHNLFITGLVCLLFFCPSYEVLFAFGVGWIQYLIVMNHSDLMDFVKYFQLGSVTSFLKNMNRSLFSGSRYIGDVAQFKEIIDNSSLLCLMMKFG